MKGRENYIIHLETCGIVGTYDEEGKLYSLVAEIEQVVTVNKTPLEIIKASIEYYGGSYEGAVTGAKSILGNIDMVPVKISGELGIYWFPSKSPQKDDCVWFATHHVKDRYPLTHSKLMVIVNGLNEIELENYTSERFEKKLDQARRLNITIDMRTNRANLYSKLKENSYQIVRDPGGIHYRINKREE